MLSPDTQAILLLCASFGQNRQTEPFPLTLGEYNTLAGWLRAENMFPQDLLNPNFISRLSQLTIGKLDSKRLVALLQRGGLLALTVEKWLNQGLWIISRGDADYPLRLKQQLKYLAPPILYGIGNKDLLSKGGLAVVGSRNVDQEGLDYTYHVVEACAEQNIQVISGGAKGVDQASMLGTLKVGGTVIGVLANNLLKASVDGKYRTSIKEGKLTLISAVDPNASFHVGNAMRRNKYIYALANYGLVISADYNTGGTWAGATEALNTIKDVPILVRIQGTISEGNQHLLKQGAKPFPETPWNRPIKELIETTVSEYKSIEFRQNNTQLNLFSQDNHSVVSDNKDELTPQDPDISSRDDALKSASERLYYAVLPIILQELNQPQDPKSLATNLDVQVGQLSKWLKKAVTDKKVIKQTKNNQVIYKSNKV
ncbi:conserved hypothetical protein [Rippkaea orientalis PCC 8801]|uniref:Smf/DprA SLOG domain-containing protein n=1 Tax=Rippkaea orientalis (strain PCC 8801 / RF-1) TaxID=41431 RepID=B7JUP3_RIPO1|nr:DNA-processing protein DprA [Rippkaea orientalis]ACK65587.1 conserved hypothetical protein [Rippkaea orientalis PCC 8801]